MIRMPELRLPQAPDGRTYLRDGAGRWWVLGEGRGFSAWRLLGGVVLEKAWTAPLSQAATAHGCDGCDFCDFGTEKAA